MITTDKNKNTFPTDSQQFNKIKIARYENKWTFSNPGTSLLFPCCTKSQKLV